MKIGFFYKLLKENRPDVSYLQILAWVLDIMCLRQLERITKRELRRKKFRVTEGRAKNILDKIEVVFWEGVLYKPARFLEIFSDALS